MNITKLTNRSLVTTEDVAFNFRLGLPVEVFCSNKGETITFGRIDHFDEDFIYIRQESFSRECYLFFGQPAH